jgi:hypothetical protein
VANGSRKRTGEAASLTASEGRRSGCALLRRSFSFLWVARSADLVGRAGTAPVAGRAALGDEVVR